MKLSILIPTVVGREEEINSLKNLLHEQVAFCRGGSSPKRGFEQYESDEVEVVILKDNKEITIGEKRELLYSLAKGMYSWQIDDDDAISDNAIVLILEAIKQNPDCITFRENCMMNGKYYSSNHSLKYDDWEGDGNAVLPDGFHFHRTPFYKDVIKTEIARSVPFEHIRYGEDISWSRRLRSLLKNEVHIDEELYHYIYEPKESHEQRYGII